MKIMRISEVTKYSFGLIFGGGLVFDGYYGGGFKVNT